MPGDSLTGSGGLCTNPSFLQVGEAWHALQVFFDAISTTFFDQELDRPSLYIEAFDAAQFWCFHLYRVQLFFCHYGEEEIENICFKERERKKRK